MYRDVKTNDALSGEHVSNHSAVITKTRNCQSIVEAINHSPNSIPGTVFECNAFLDSGTIQSESGHGSESISHSPHILPAAQNQIELMPPNKIKTEDDKDASFSTIVQETESNFDSIRVTVKLEPEDEDASFPTIVRETESNLDPILVTVKLEPDRSTSDSVVDRSQAISEHESAQFELIPKLEESTDSDLDDDDDDAYNTYECDETNSPNVDEANELDRSMDTSSLTASTSKLDNLEDPSTGTAVESGKNPNDWQHKCPVCAKRFQCPSHVIPHLNAHTGIKPYECSVCERAFSQRTHLKTHMRTHTGEKPYTCKVCQRAFAQGTTLEKHMRIHTGEKPFTCLVCSKTFRHDCDVRRHLKTHETELAAQKFEKSGESENRLLSVRSNEMRLSTPAAMVDQTEPAVVAFKRDPQSLMRNKKLIDNNRLKCPKCSKVFTRSSGLKRHIRTHTGERPYKCDVCPRTFNDSSTLICHSRVHTGEKPYKCNVCVMSFSKPHSLKRHTLIHTDEKPFKCTFCPMSSRTSQNLKKHLQTHAATTMS